MNTYAPYASVTETFTYPSTPDAGTPSVIVYYEFGDTVLSATAPTLVSGTTYSISINDELLGSSGVYRIKWSCEFSGTDFYAFTEFKIEDTYVQSASFFDTYSEFDTPEYTTRFASTEKVARRIIDTYTGQSFQFIKNKTLKFDGNNRENLYLGRRLNSFTSVFVDETDFTANVRLDYQSKFFLKTLAPYPYDELTKNDMRPVIFPVKSTVTVTGDWGWLTVPWEVTQATELLIIDLLEDTRREHYRYGITRLEQGNNRLEFDPNIYNSTGNIDVDTLLMDFVHWTMDYVTF